MRRLGATFVCCVLFHLALPAPADALFWRWLDELSGPGPFNGIEIEARLYCFPDRVQRSVATPAQTMDANGQAGGSSVLEAGKREARAPRRAFLAAQLPCLNKSSREGPRKASVNLTTSYNWARNSNQIYADGRDHKVHYIEVRPSVWVRPARSIDVGTGVSWLLFRGDRFDSFSRIAFEPVMVDIKPFALLNDLRRRTPLVRKYVMPDAEGDLFLTFRTGVMLMPKGFTDRDFGAEPNTFSVGHEWLPMFSVLLDLDFLRRRVRH